MSLLRHAAAAPLKRQDHSLPHSHYHPLNPLNPPPDHLSVRRTQALVVGCGAAGSAAALRLAREGVRVIVLGAAANPADCNTYWAQGGIIYKSPDDSPDLLSSDIHRAGAGVCHD
ncbi:hypothetical protein As57867_004148, partial [Aphanomyces stellatus]